MLYLIDNAISLDTVINDINTRVFNSLKWTESRGINYHAFNQADKNPRDSSGDIIPETFYKRDIDTNGEYTEAFFDDSVDASSFFVVPDEINSLDNGYVYNTTIDMIFQVDLDVVAANVPNHRAKEEIINKAIQGVRASQYHWNDISISKTVPVVYSDFSTTGIEFTSMNNFFCFKLGIDVTYGYSCIDDKDLITLDSFLLKEDGFSILLENGFKIILE